jgi:hypothetical protein
MGMLGENDGLHGGKVESSNQARSRAVVLARAHLITDRNKPQSTLVEHSVANTVQCSGIVCGVEIGPRSDGEGGREVCSTKECVSPPHLTRQ